MDTRAAALNVWKAFGSRDAAAIRDVLTEDVEWIAPRRNATAVALDITHHMIGPEAISSFLVDDMWRLFPDGFSIEPITVTVEANRAVFEQRQSATLANGRTYDNVYVFIFEMAGPRVRRIREYMDTLAGYGMVFGEAAPGRLV